MSEQEMREKVIKGLEKLNENSGCIEINSNGCKTCPYDSVNRCCGQIIGDAIALLKAQEPVKPKYVEFEDTGLTWEKYEVATCGKCGALLGDALYCPMCGQAVKWE